MVAVSTRVGDGPRLYGGERAVGAGAQLDRDPHGVPGDAADELFLTGELERDGSPRIERRQRHDVLGEKLLLAAEAAAYALAEDSDGTGLQAEQIGQLLFATHGDCELVRTTSRLSSSIQLIEQCVSR